MNKFGSLSRQDQRYAEVDLVDLVPSLNDSTILREDQLRDLSKNITKIVPKTCGSYDVEAKTYSELFEVLLRTARDLNTTVFHNAAAYNTLCNFLDQCMITTVTKIHSLCFSASTWNEVFDIFLTRSENAKAKPTKHLLVTLNKLLSKNPNASIIHSIKSFTIIKLVTIICGRESQACVKQALQASDHFVTKRTIRLSELLSEFNRVSKKKSEHSTSTKCAAYTHVSGSLKLSEEKLSENAANIFENILYWMNYPDIAPIACRFFTSISNYCSAAVGSGLPPWYHPLRRALGSKPTLIDVFETQLLTGLLQSNLDHTVAFLEELPYSEIRNGLAGHLKLVEVALCLTSLRIAQRLRLDDFLDTNTKSDNVVFLATLFDSPSIVFSLLDHASCRIRYAALTVVLHWKTTSTPLAFNIFKVLQKSLPNFHAEVDTKTRNDFISVMVNFCTRIKSSLFQPPNSPDQLHPLVFDILKTQGTGFKTAQHDLPGFHVWFMTWYHAFLFQELRPTKSYQRHITALRVLESIVARDRSFYQAQASHEAQDFEANKGLTSRNAMSTQLSRLLLDLVLDPFDDVRDAAASLLEMVDPSVLESRLDMHSEVENIVVPPAFDAWDKHSSISITRAEKMMRNTGRADYADGVGRLHNRLYASGGTLDNKPKTLGRQRSILESILRKLRHDVAVTQLDLRRAISGAPLHGYLIALRYIVGRPDFCYHDHEAVDQRLLPRPKFHRQILERCVEIWNTVQCVLCNDSPEGHIPDPGEETNMDVGTKDILSFSWRALKESSSLMHAMITNSPGNPSSNLVLLYKDYKALAALAFEQLAELRHRGAFSTVAQTFTACCMKCTQLHIASLDDLPRIWYRDALACIQDKTSTLTRRSAGLPAIITGILIAIPSGTFFDNAILDLQAIADAPVLYGREAGEPHLPQVHAMNCLKDLFTNTRLGSSTECYVENTLSIAAERLESDVWAIRNCGLMLLKALLNRMTGGSDAYHEKRVGTTLPSPIVYEKYQNLPSLLLTMLRVENIGCYTSRAQQVFPALEMIERWGLPKQQKVTISQLVWHHMESSDWSIREKAAKAMCTVMYGKATDKKIGDLLDPEWPSQNALHGRLLCARFLLARKKRASFGITFDSLVPFLAAFASPFDTLFLHNACPSTNIALFQFFATLLKALQKHRVSEAQQFALAQRQPMWSKWFALHQHCSSAPAEIENRAYAPESASLVHCLIVIEMICAYLPKELVDILSSLVDQLCKFDIKDVLRIMLHLKNIPRVHDCEDTRSILLILVSILRDSTNPNVRTAVTGSIADIISATNLIKGWDLTVGKEPISSLLDLQDTKISSLPPNPYDFDADLHFCGNVMNVAYPSRPGDPRVLKILGCWIKQLSLAGDERSVEHRVVGKGYMVVPPSVPYLRHSLCHSRRQLSYTLNYILCSIEGVPANINRKELSTRLAAVQSIHDFQGALRRYDSEPRTAPELLNIYLVLYDTLHDDDEEVRDQGAIIVSWLLSDPIAAGDSFQTANLSLMPLAASSRLIVFLTTGYQTSKALWKEAVRRVTGMASTAHLRSARELLKKATTEDTALFVEEKQNLFVDPVSEAETWTKALEDMDSEAIDSELVPHLSGWVTEGLQCLIGHTERETDGPLGWTSKPAAFELGSRIILAAGVLLHLIRIGASEANEPSVRDNLTALLKAGNRNELHGLWLQRIEEILDK